MQYHKLISICKGTRTVRSFENPWKNKMQSADERKFDHLGACKIMSVQMWSGGADDVGDEAAVAMRDARMNKTQRATEDRTLLKPLVPCSAQFSVRGWVKLAPAARGSQDSRNLLGRNLHHKVKFRMIHSLISLLARQQYTNNCNKGRFNGRINAAGSLLSRLFCVEVRRPRSTVVSLGSSLGRL